MPYGPFQHGWPYSNFHDLNLDWILKEILAMNEKIQNFTALTKIVYANPFEWDITQQYGEYTLVLDPQTLIVYISKKTVPSGIQISNTDYWESVCDLSGIYAQLVSAITQDTYRMFNLPATSDIKTGDLVWINNALYKATSPTNTGITIAEGNFEKTSLNDEFQALVSENNTAIKVAVQELNSRISNIIADGTQTEGNTELIDIRTAFNGDVYQTAGDAVRGQTKENNFLLKSAINCDYNILENTDFIIGEIYTYQSLNTEKNSAGNRYALIPLQAGVTYYLRSCWLYFCTFHPYNTQTYTQLSPSSSTFNGVFTPNQNGVLGVTVPASRSTAVSALLTTSESFYNAGSQDTYPSSFTFNRLQLPSGAKTFYTCYKDGSGDYTSLKDCLQAAIQVPNSTVIVGPGVWDIIQEFGDDIENININNRGIYLQNGVKVFFSSNSKAVCKYTGTNNNVINWLSAFNAGPGGFELHNCVMECSNIRYPIHDERDQDTDYYRNVIDGCYITFDNGDNSSYFCIGGGFGQNGSVVIKDCYFNSVNKSIAVSYHNTGAASGRSNLVLSGCYFEGLCRPRFTYYGSSTDMTTILVTNCKFTGNIVTGPEIGTAQVNNVVIRDFNNVSQ